MLDIALKNVTRQKARSALTIAGIAMGIGLILGLGSIGSGLNKQLNDQFGSMAAVINVRAIDQSNGAPSAIPDYVISGISDISGVDQVIPIGNYRVTRGNRGFGGFGGPGGGLFGRGGGGGSITFTGVDPDNLHYLIGDDIVADQGRLLDSSDATGEVVVLGHDTATNQNLNLGDEIDYQQKVDQSTKDYFFSVVGILEQTGTSSIDSAAYTPLKTMQDIEGTENVTQLTVTLLSINDVESITQQITDDYSDEVSAFSMISVIRQIQSTLQTVQMAVYGIGAVSIIVGGLGVMNTMIMSVMERRREIGVMKAIGATTTMILVQVLQESAVLSLIGGFVGLALGYLSMSLITKYTTFKPLMTPELIAIGLGFSIILGMGAGLYPAWSASRMDPIKVLRYE